MAAVKIFTASRCSESDQAKRALKRHGIRFEEFNVSLRQGTCVQFKIHVRWTITLTIFALCLIVCISQFIECFEDMLVLSGYDTTPQLFFGKQHTTLDNIISLQNNTTQKSSSTRSLGRRSFAFPEAAIGRLRRGVSLSSISLTNTTVESSNSSAKQLPVYLLQGPQLFGKPKRTDLLILNSHRSGDSTNTSSGNHNLDAFDTLVQLCKRMDKVVRESSTRGEDSTDMYEIFQNEVCQLQLVDLDTIPSTCNGHLAFGLNLYNLMVRHALLELETSYHQPTWPTNFDGLRMLFSRVYYVVGGKHVCLRNLQESLWTGLEQRRKPHLLRRLPPHRPATPETIGILLAMTLGTCDSPQIQTFDDPSRLPQELSANAREFCQSHVQIFQQVVVLPALSTLVEPENPSQVFSLLQGFLSVKQRTALKSVQTVEFAPHNFESLLFHHPSATRQRFQERQLEWLDDDVALRLEERIATDPQRLVNTSTDHSFLSKESKRSLAQEGPKVAGATSGENSWSFNSKSLWSLIVPPGFRSMVSRKNSKHRDELEPIDDYVSGEEDLDDTPSFFTRSYGDTPSFFTHSQDDGSLSDQQSELQDMTELFNESNITLEFEYPANFGRDSRVDVRR
jgi:glutaredoxin